MNLNESLTQAFDTICEVACFDSHSLVPHPENLKFQASVERSVMHRLGMTLTEVVSDVDGEDAQNVARTLHRYFWQELNLPFPPDLTAELPRCLQKSDHKIEPIIELHKLAIQLSAIKPSEAHETCIVASNLTMLQKLLNLSDTAIKFLKLAYVNSSTNFLTKDLTSGLRLALKYINISNDNHRNCAVAKLLDEPLVAVENLFSVPLSLVGLRFVDAAAYNNKRHLHDVFLLADDFVEVLETPYRSQQALIAAILEPENDHNLTVDDTTPIGYLYDIMPKAIAECYERCVLNRPMLSQHVHDVVAWFTGGLTLPYETVHPLESHITFEAIREAIKHAALNCCQTKETLNAHALLKAIYNASS